MVCERGGRKIAVRMAGEKLYCGEDGGRKIFRPYSSVTHPSEAVFTFLMYL